MQMAKVLRLAHRHREPAAGDWDTTQRRTTRLRNATDLDALPAPPTSSTETTPSGPRSENTSRSPAVASPVKAEQASCSTAPESSGQTNEDPTVGAAPTKAAGCVAPACWKQALSLVATGYTVLAKAQALMNMRNER